MKMPELHDTRDKMVCPLCHGTGKTTGRKVYHFIDGIVGHLHSDYMDMIGGIRKTMMRRLWRIHDDNS